MHLLGAEISLRILVPNDLIQDDEFAHVVDLVFNAMDEDSPFCIQEAWTLSFDVAARCLDHFKPRNAVGINRWLTVFPPEVMQQGDNAFNYRWLHLLSGVIGTDSKARHQLNSSFTAIVFSMLDVLLNDNVYAEAAYALWEVIGTSDASKKFEVLYSLYARQAITPEVFQSKTLEVIRACPNERAGRDLINQILDASLSDDTPLLRQIQRYAVLLKPPWLSSERLNSGEVTGRDLLALYQYFDPERKRDTEQAHWLGMVFGYLRQTNRFPDTYLVPVMFQALCWAGDFEQASVLIDQFDNLRFRFNNTMISGKEYIENTRKEVAVVTPYPMFDNILLSLTRWFLDGT